jgi:hypothetical protein
VFRNEVEGLAGFCTGEPAPAGEAADQAAAGQCSAFPVV